MPSSRRQLEEAFGGVGVNATSPDELSQAVNVAMDLKPFRRINPCGFEDLEVTQLSELCGVTDIQAVRGELEFMLRQRFTGTTKRARGWRANMLSREANSLER